MQFYFLMKLMQYLVKGQKLKTLMIGMPILRQAYLLQKIEEHKEIVILASNFKRNIDEAFIRRMHFVIEFPFPDEQNRLSIWKNIFQNQI